MNTNKTIEILIHLLGYLEEHNFDMESLSDFSEHLIIDGYNASEVNDALGLLAGKLAYPAEASYEDFHENTKGAVRILSETERMAISSATYGYILRLESLSLVTGRQREKLIEYCLLMSPRALTEADINEALAAILFEEIED